MKDYTTVRQVVEQTIDEQYSVLPIVFENVKLGSDNAEHITIVDEGEIVVTQLEMGSDIKKAESELVIGIFTALGTGTEKAKQVARDLDNIFNRDINGIYFKERQLMTVGEREGSPFYQHNLIVPYVHFYGQDDS